MSDTPENPENPATKRASLGTVAVAAAILLAALFLAPGFIAAIWSRIVHRPVLIYHNYSGTPTMAEDIVFAPACFAVNHIPASARFYVWEYRLLGGDWPPP